MHRLIALALAVAAALPAVPSSAAPRARAEVSSFDGAILVGAADGFGANAALYRLTTTSGGLYTGGPSRRDPVTYTVLCLARGTRRSHESGCTYSLDSAPVTTGLLLPEGATLRGRVPTYGKRGAWMEADLAFTATGDPYLPPASGGYWAFFTDVAGVEVPASLGGSAGPYVERKATVEGTFRTESTPASRVRAVAPYTFLVRTDKLSFSGSPGIGDIVRHLGDATVATLPA